MAVLLRGVVEHEWSFSLSGVLSVILGVVLLLLPGAGLLAYTWLIGLLALAVGIALIYYSSGCEGRGRVEAAERPEKPNGNERLDPLLYL